VAMQEEGVNRVIEERVAKMSEEQMRLRGE